MNRERKVGDEKAAAGKKTQCSLRTGLRSLCERLAKEPQAAVLRVLQREDAMGEGSAAWGRAGRRVARGQERATVMPGLSQ